MWATQAPRRSPPPWAEAPCHGSTASFCATPALATRAWWALRRLPALTFIYLEDNPFGDEGIAALVAPPPPVGALPPPVGALPPSKGVLTKLTDLYLGRTQITDAGCAALAAALDSGALPALETLYLGGIPASAAAQAAVHEALAKSTAGIPSLSLLALS